MRRQPEASISFACVLPVAWPILPCALSLLRARLPFRSARSPYLLSAAPRINGPALFPACPGTLLGNMQEEHTFMREIHREVHTLQARDTPKDTCERYMIWNAKTRAQEHSWEQGDKERSFSLTATLPSGQNPGGIMPNTSGGTVRLGQKHFKRDRFLSKRESTSKRLSPLRQPHRADSPAPASQAPGCPLSGNHQAGRRHCCPPDVRTAVPQPAVYDRSAPCPSGCEPDPPSGQKQPRAGRQSLIGPAKAEGSSPREAG